MRESIPREVFPALVIALGMIVLSPAPMLARSYLDVPLPFYLLPLLVLGLLPVILIEGFVLRWRMELGWSRALGVAALANFVSTFIGILLQGWIFPFSQEYLPWNRRELIHPPPRWAVLFLLLFFVLVPLFFISWLVEYPVAQFMLRPRRSVSPTPSSSAVPVSSQSPKPSAALRRPISLIRGMFDANLASYLFLGMIAGGFLMSKLLLNPLPPRYWSPVGVLRTINTSEVTYSSTYPKGFSPSLAALGPPPGTQPTAEAAGLIDPQLATGVEYGYTFTYKAVPDADSIIRHYTVVARPLKYHRESYPPTNSFFTDETGVIRSTDEDREATSSDPPLGG
jgi:type IV pilus assembly protein PilA